MTEQTNPPAPTLERAARAAYLSMIEREDIPDAWNDSPELREWWTEAARACIGAMLPVSDEFARKVENDPKRSAETSAKGK